jgi:hypothetical protein
MKSKNREYGPADFQKMLHGLTEAADQIANEQLEQMAQTVVFSRSLTPNIAGSLWSAEGELPLGARRARVDRRTNGVVVEGTAAYPAKVAMQRVRELILTSADEALKADEYIVVCTQADSPEKLAATAENLTRYRRSRIRMPRIADVKQLEMTDDQRREYLRLAQQRTRDRRKIRGGN